MIIESRAYARAGLLGNPSDGYHGRTLSVIIKNFGAYVSLYETPELHIEPQEQDRNIYRNVYHLVESVALTGYYGGSRLVKAAIRKFVAHCDEQGLRLPNKNFTVRYGSSIPRQVGLAGSSAIVTATMRALMRFYDVEIPAYELPSLVLAAEQGELGINAGLQDRVIQAYEGCVYMDFEREYVEKKGRGRYERIDPTLLPNLYVAYKTELGKESGKVLNTLRQRYERGEPETLSALSELADNTTLGRDALINRDYDTLGQLIDRNFDLRRSLMDIRDSDLTLVECARQCGASAKFTGSGGSIIGVYRDDEMLNKLFVELKKINARVLKPYVF
ncbi:MAG: GHMP kinase [Catalinimonas sp.]